MNARNVLLVGANWLGDAVMSLPAVRLWRAAHPDGRLVVLSRPALADFWRMCEACNDVIVWPAASAALWRGARELTRWNFDTAWILPNSFRSALLPRLSGIPRRRGFAGQWRRALLTEVVPRPRRADRRHQAWESVAILDVEPRAGRLPVPGLRIPPQGPAPAGTARDAPGLGLFPGAARGPAKRWPAECFVRAARRVVAAMPSVRVRVFGTLAERPVCAAVAAAIGPAARNCAGETGLIGLAAELGACACVLCNDSGGMHLAAALGIPVVAIFGLTDPAVTGPLGPGHATLRGPDPGVRIGRRIGRRSPAAAAALARVDPEAAAAAILQRFERGAAPAAGVTDAP